MNLLKSSVLALAALLSVPLASVPARAGGVDNGEGIAEKNMVFAYLQLGRYLELCLSSQSCKLSQKERDLLFKIRVNLITEVNADLSVKFRSEKKDPGFFKIDGHVRIAKTGSSVGDPIYVNLDMLYTTNIYGVVEAMDIPGAVSLLVHELGHHQGEKDHTFLDLLGSRIQLFVAGHTQVIGYGRYHSQLTATLLDFFEHETATQVFLSDGIQLVPVNEAINQAAVCFDGTSARGIWLWNARWDLYRKLITGPNGTVIVPLRAEMVLTCPDPTKPSGFNLQARHQLLLEIPVKITQGKYLFTGEKPRAYAIDCRDQNGLASCF